MNAEMNGADVLKYEIGMAPFVDDLMRITSPQVRRSAIRHRKPLVNKDEFYWLVRSTANYMLHVGRGFDVVICIAVVRQSGVDLSVFTDNYKQAEQVNRQGAIVSYMLTACTCDEDAWILKVVQEKFNEQQ